eukprot:g4808.t1
MFYTISSICSAIDITRTANESSGIYDVIIVGAGISGLKAAEVLHKHNKKMKILILEAQNHIGGRVHTIFDEELNESINLGASYIHGASFVNNEYGTNGNKNEHFNTKDSYHNMYAKNPLLQYFDNGKEMLYEMKFLPPLDSKPLEKVVAANRSLVPLTNNDLIIHISDKHSRKISAESFLNAYNLYCRVLEQSALEAQKILSSSIRKDNRTIFKSNNGSKNIRQEFDFMNNFHLLYFFNKTIQNMSVVEKWNKNTSELVFYMLEFALDDLGVPLEAAHPYFWDTEDNTFPGYDAQIKDVKYKMNILIHHLLNRSNFNISSINSDAKRRSKLTNINGNVELLLNSKVITVAYGNNELTAKHKAAATVQTVEEKCSTVSYNKDNKENNNANSDAEYGCFNVVKKYSASSGIIVTVSVGVLNDAVNNKLDEGDNSNQENHISFYPSLPKIILEALSTRQMGETVKVFLKFTTLFWQKNIHLYTSILNKEDRSFNVFKLIWNEYQDYQSVDDEMYYLCLTSTGFESIQQIKKLRDENRLIEVALQTIIKVFQNIITDVDDVKIMIYNVYGGYNIAWWTHDGNPYVKGSWSSWRSNSTVEYISTLENINYILPEGSKLYFAGESFSRHYHGTMHGAMLSGEQAAIDLLSNLADDLYDMKISYGIDRITAEDADFDRIGIMYNNINIKHGKFIFDLDDTNCTELLNYMYLMVLKQNLNFVELIDPPILKQRNKLQGKHDNREYNEDKRIECAKSYSKFLRNIGKDLLLIGLNIGNGDIDDDEMVEIVNRIKGRPLQLQLLNISSNNIGDTGLTLLVNHLVADSYKATTELHVYAADNYLSKLAVEKLYGKIALSSNSRMNMTYLNYIGR